MKHTAVVVEWIYSQPQSTLGREDPDLVPGEKKKEVIYICHTAVLGWARAAELGGIWWAVKNEERVIFKLMTSKEDPKSLKNKQCFLLVAGEHYLETVGREKELWTRSTQIKMVTDIKLLICKSYTVLFIYLFLASGL